MCSFGGVRAGRPREPGRCRCPFFAQRLTIVPSRLTFFAALMSVSSIYAAKWGAKLASSASENFLRRALGCFMLVSVPFVVAKTGWWQETMNQTAQSLENTSSVENELTTIAKVSATCRAKKEQLVTKFQNLLESRHGLVDARFPQVAAAMQGIFEVRERIMADCLELSAAFEHKVSVEFPRVAAAATAFLSTAGLTGPDSLKRGCAYLLLGAAGGCVSGMLGVGGGVVFTPCLAAFSSMPHVTILGTAMLTMIPATISGTLQHHAARNILWPQAAALATGSLVGATAGSNFALNVSDDALRFVFAAMMSILGARTLLR